MRSAVRKAVYHKGLSSGDSIERYNVWIWLLNDGNYDKIDWDNYTNYGCPILLRIMELYDIPFPDDEYAEYKEIFYTMAKGQICESCQEGDTSGCGLDS